MLHYCLYIACRIVVIIYFLQYHENVHFSIIMERFAMIIIMKVGFVSVFKLLL